MPKGDSYFHLDVYTRKTSGGENCEVSRMNTLPTKLAKDAILEALFEVQFSHDELPELVFARLVDLDLWQGFQQVRLPLSQMPAEVRNLDPNLRFQPTLRLQSPDAREVANVGTNVISFHNNNGYFGWSSGFSDRIFFLIDSLYNISSLRIEKLTLRYVNALTKLDHKVNSPNDIELSLSVKNQNIANSFNVNLRDDSDKDFTVLTRIATPDFINGPLPSGTSIYIDVDVSNNKPDPSISKDDLKSWVDDAHNREKEEFFGFIPEAIISELSE